MSPEQNQEPKKNNASRSVLVKVLFVGLIILAVIAATAFMVLRDKKVTDAPAPPPPASGVTLSLEPTTKTVKKDEPFTMDLWLDTDGQEIIALEAIVAYPNELFEITNIDDTNSALSLDVEKAFGDGEIRITRGHVEGVTGRHLVAKVTAKPLVQGEGTFSFKDNSATLRSSDNTNVLARKIEAKYRVEADE